MKRLYKIILLPILTLSLTACDLIDDIFGGGDNDIQHSKSYEPITGKFYLYEATDKRVTFTDTYFDIDGSAGNFSLKYYENGTLKKEGIFNKVVTRKENIGLIKDNLHFNIKCGNSTEHISTYTESLDPIDQFRIIEEYTGADKRYYLSELPFIMGTYVREGKEYKKEKKTTADKDYTVPSLEEFTSSLNGKFLLDNDHYFYFVYPGINDYYAKAYFQYFSPSLSKPLEGFVNGRTYTNLDNVPTLVFTYSREVLIYTSDRDSNKSLYFGYYSVNSNDRLVEHWGSVDFSNGAVNSFTFEHLSRTWTDEEMDRWTKELEYRLPDPVIYDYVGGTYTRA